MRRFLAKDRYELPLNGVDPDRVAFMIGHDLGRSAIRRFSGRELREIVLIRDPLNRYVSHYGQYFRTRMEAGNRSVATFEEWYASQRPNYMTEFFLTRYLGIGELAVFAMPEQTQFDIMNESLKQFWYVAGHQYCDDLLTALSRGFGIPSIIQRQNVRPRNLTDVDEIPAVLRSRIVRENAVDQAIFDVWKDIGFVRQAEEVDAPCLSHNPLKHMPRKTSRLFAKVALKVSTGGNGRTSAQL